LTDTDCPAQQDVRGVCDSRCGPD